MEFFGRIERSQVLDFSEKMISLTVENEPLKILTQMQNYLGAILSGSSVSRAKQYEIINHLKMIEEAKKQLGVNMNPQTVFENLAFKLVLSQVLFHCLDSFCRFSFHKNIFAFRRIYNTSFNCAFICKCQKLVQRLNFFVYLLHPLL